VIAAVSLNIMPLTTNDTLTVADYPAGMTEELTRLITVNGENVSEMGSISGNELAMGFTSMFVTAALQNSDNANKSLRYNINYSVPVSANTFVYSEAAILDQINMANEQREAMLAEANKTMLLTLGVMLGSIALTIIIGAALASTGIGSGISAWLTAHGLTALVALGSFLAKAYLVSQLVIFAGCLLDGSFEKTTVSALNAITGSFSLGKLGGFLYHNIYDWDYTIARLTIHCINPALDPILFEEWENDSGGFWYFDTR